MGRSIGIGVVSFSGVRVLGDLLYIPAHINAAGKRINAKAEIPVRLNIHKGSHLDVATNQMVPGQKFDFRLTAWGKLADIMCRSCAPGKALDVVCEPRTYQGKLYNRDGSLRLDAAGQAITITKTAFNIIMYPVFGEESQKRIDKEIAAKVRPADWNVVGSAGYNWWVAHLKALQAYNWDGQSDRFLYARVKLPQGQLDFSHLNGGVVAGQPVTAAAGQPGQIYQPQQQQIIQPVTQPVNTPSMVAHAVNTQPVTQPVTVAAGNPVDLNATVMLANGGAAPTAPVAPQGMTQPGAGVTSLI